MYNYEARWWETDDLDLRNFDADTGAIGREKDAMTVEKHFVIDQLPAHVLHRPPRTSTRSPSIDAEHGRGALQGIAASDDRAVRSEGHRASRTTATSIPTVKTTAGSTCRSCAACAVSRPRSAPTRCSARTPTSTATAATPATSRGWTGSSSARRTILGCVPRRELPGEVGRGDGRLRVRRRVGDAQGLRRRGRRRSCRSTPTASA